MVSDFTKETFIPKAESLSDRLDRLLKEDKFDRLLKEAEAIGFENGLRYAADVAENMDLPNMCSDMFKDGFELATNHIATKLRKEVEGE